MLCAGKPDAQLPQCPGAIPRSTCHDVGARQAEGLARAAFRASSKGRAFEPAPVQTTAKNSCLFWKREPSQEWEQGPNRVDSGPTLSLVARQHCPKCVLPSALLLLRQSKLKGVPLPARLFIGCNMHA